MKIKMKDPRILARFIYLQASSFYSHPSFWTFDGLVNFPRDLTSRIFVKSDIKTHLILSFRSHTCSPSILPEIPPEIPPDTSQMTSLPSLPAV